MKKQTFRAITLVVMLSCLQAFGIRESLASGTYDGGLKKWIYDEFPGPEYDLHGMIGPYAGDFMGAAGWWSNINRNMYRISPGSWFDWPDIHLWGVGTGTIGSDLGRALVTIYDNRVIEATIYINTSNPAYGLTSGGAPGQSSQSPYAIVIAAHEFGHASGILTHHYRGNTSDYHVMDEDYGRNPHVWPYLVLQSYEQILIQGMYGNGWGKLVTGDQVRPLPEQFALAPPAPNPFNGSTTISLDVPVGAYVQLRIYNSVGQWVRTLVIDQLAAGQYTYTWDGRDNHGRTVGNGVYLARLEVPERAFMATQQMLLLK